MSALSTDDLRTIEALSIEWAWRLDHGRARTIVELLTLDATVNLFGEDWNPAAFGNWARCRDHRRDRHTHHQMTNLRVQIEDGRVRGHAMVVLRTVTDERVAPEVEFIGEYHDEYAQPGDGWRVARRVLVPLGRF